MQHEYRIFGKEKYVLIGRHTSKKKADKHAKAMRKEGGFARVVPKAETSGGTKSMYQVWYRGNY